MPTSTAPYSTENDYSSLLNFRDYKTAIKVILENDVNPNLFQYGFTALHIATIEGDIEGVTQLLEKGADPNAVNGNEDSPLLKAFIYNHVEIAEKLLEHGADPNAKDAYGLLPLHINANNSCIRICKALLNKGADPRQLKRGGSNELSWAIENLHLDIAYQLMEKGANQSRYAFDGVSLLVLALIHDTALARTLIESRKKSFQQSDLNREADRQLDQLLNLYLSSGSMYSDSQKLSFARQVERAERDVIQERPVVVIGDGPVALFAAIRHMKSGRRVLLLGERGGIYLRKQMIRFDLPFIKNLLQEFGYNGKTVKEANLFIAGMIGERDANKQYLKALTNQYQTTTHFMIQLKHLEQLFYHYLRQNHGLVQMEVGAPTSQAPGHKTNSHINEDGTVTYTDSRGQLQTVHPSRICIADGAKSLEQGVLSQVNKILPEGLRFTKAPPLLVGRKLPAPYHAVGNYTIPKAREDSIEKLVNAFNTFTNQEQGDTLKPDAHLKSLGWHYHVAPLARIFVADSDIYIGAELPKAIYDIQDKDLKKQKISEWHHALLEKVLSHMLSESASLQKHPKKSSSPIEHYQHRAEEKIEVTAFKVTLEGGVAEDEDLGFVRNIAGVNIFPLGDALDGPWTHYQTASGLVFGLEQVMLLPRQELTSLNFYNRRVSTLRREKNTKAISLATERLDNGITDESDSDGDINLSSLYDGRTPVTSQLSLFMRKRCKEMKFEGNTRTLNQLLRGTRVTLL